MPGGRQIGELLLLPVDLVEQRNAVIQPADFNPRCQAQAVYPEVARVRIAVNLPGVVPGTEEASMLAGPGERTLDQERRQINTAGDAIVTRPKMIESGCVARPVITGGHLIEERPGLRMAGQD